MVSIAAFGPGYPGSNPGKSNWFFKNMPLEKKQYKSTILKPFFQEYTVVWWLAKLPLVRETQVQTPASTFWMNIMAHKTKEKTKENTKEKTKEIFLDCLVLKTLEFTKDITMDFGSRESLEIGNQGIDQAPRNIPWFLEAIPKEDVSWVWL